ncbi:hypothetical protein SAMN05192583_2121 [Sphingomonas gellani]|uniref:YozE SAM-like fold n=1 Tax=Sphingomonas gellani TaxID=1166340 RepID=A0A1H8EC05_9SPHN|nr:hypothetical protein [Sphingomonas gellani]SEN16910.1 hypothetical protein SAMN05192583_2121 [Sphingomonas gellani]
MNMDLYTPAKPAFGSWLIAQKDRGGLLGQLAAGAAADRGFPKHGDPDAVRKRLVALQADGDMHSALDDAEVDWLAY